MKKTITITIAIMLMIPGEASALRPMAKAISPGTAGGIRNSPFIYIDEITGKTVLKLFSDFEETITPPYLQQRTGLGRIVAESIDNMTKRRKFLSNIARAREEVIAVPSAASYRAFYGVYAGLLTLEHCRRLAESYEMNEDFVAMLNRIKVLTGVDRIDITIVGRGITQPFQMFFQRQDIQDRMKKLSAMVVKFTTNTFVFGADDVFTGEIIPDPLVLEKDEYVPDGALFLGDERDKRYNIANFINVNEGVEAADPTIRNWINAQAVLNNQTVDRKEHLQNVREKGWDALSSNAKYVLLHPDEAQWMVNFLPLTYYEIYTFLSPLEPTEHTRKFFREHEGLFNMLDRRSLICRIIEVATFKEAGFSEDDIDLSDYMLLAYDSKESRMRARQKREDLLETGQPAEIKEKFDRYVATIYRMYCEAVIFAAELGPETACFGAGDENDFYTAVGIDAVEDYADKNGLTSISAWKYLGSGRYCILSGDIPGAIKAFEYSLSEDTSMGLITYDKAPHSAFHRGTKAFIEKLLLQMKAEGIGGAEQIMQELGVDIFSSAVVSQIMEGVTGPVSGEGYQTSHTAIAECA